MRVLLIVSDIAPVAAPPTGVSAKVPAALVPFGGKVRRKHPFGDAAKAGAATPTARTGVAQAMPLATCRRVMAPGPD